MSFCGHSVALWNGQNSIFDLFHEFKPELFIIERESITDTVGRCLKKYPATRLVVYNGTWNRCDLSISDNIDSPYFFLPAACNVLHYTNPKQNKIFECDIGYIGKNNKYIQEICQLDLNIKTFGENIGNQYYCGFLRQELIGDFFKTAECILHIHEQECSQQIFDIMYCGGQILSDRTKTTFNLIDNRVFYIEDEKYIQFAAVLASTNRLEYKLKENREFIFDQHTYFDRCLSLFKELGLPHSEFQSRKQQFKNQYNVI